MLVFAMIVTALIVGAWAGIMFDGWTLDAEYGDAESFGTYLRDPWWTLKRFWSVLGAEAE